MTDSDRSPSDWGAAYRDQLQLYDAFSGRVRVLLSELLRADGITAVQVDARTKEVDSFVDKVARRPGKYQNPLVDITDLSGVRVIL
jgi:ppGpp synthetase/RelA/SpoT-type nucleotidyltranferase